MIDIQRALTYIDSMAFGIAMSSVVDSGLQEALLKDFDVLRGFLTEEEE